MLRSAHFGFAPRGDARFSYRFSELAASAVLPITFNDWALPFHQLIDWHAIGIVLNASILDRRVEQVSTRPRGPSAAPLRSAFSPQPSALSLQPSATRPALSLTTCSQPSTLT
eukprot:4613176-Prymnesium_polylepis.1